MSRHFFVLINPQSGRGKSQKIGKKVSAFLKSQDIKFTVFETHNDCRGAQTVEENLTNTFTDLMIIGGDGTINEAINGLKLDLPVSFIPSGSGNDFVKNIHIGSTLEIQLDNALHGPINRIDIGLCNDRKFINGVGIGFDGQIAADMIHRKVPLLSGQLKYYYHVLHILGSYKYRNFDLTIDQVPQKQNLILLTIANGTTFGGGFKLTPHAKLNDGKLAICAIGELSPLQRYLKVLTLQKGSHHRLKEVSLFDAKEISIGKHQHLEAHIDGEYFNQPPFTISILPSALQIRASLF
jgi:diacylglycerol kinase (ATP)|tara:strand:- start:746 stop:1630 length:885 start_codon:yes stop_codon:yes gene_type:complete